MHKLVIILGMFCMLSGCSLVKLSPAGENVAVMQMNQISNCTNTGSTTVSVVNKVVVNRNPQKVALELRTLARNRAADRGDTIVAMTPVTDGEQTFNIYRCRR